MAITYVAAVTVSALVATADPNHPRPLWFAATVVMCLPAFIPAVPAFFIVVSTAWNLTGADHGGTGWPVTATYVGALSCVSVANAWIVGRLARAWTGRRSGRARDVEALRG
jgi:uncharacterized membrane protein YjjB (DUF3815 family)